MESDAEERHKENGKPAREYSRRRPIINNGKRAILGSRQSLNSVPPARLVVSSLRLGCKQRSNGDLLLFFAGDQTPTTPSRGGLRRAAP
jgi:hypothetical protein